MNYLPYALVPTLNERDIERILRSKDRESAIRGLEEYVVLTAESAVRRLQTAESLIGQGKIIEAEGDFRTAESLIESLQEDGYNIPTPPYLEKVRRRVYTLDTLPTFLRHAKQLIEHQMLGTWDYFKGVIFSARRCGLELPDPEYSETMQQAAHATLYVLLRLAKDSVINPMHIFFDKERGKSWFRDAVVLRKEAEENGVEFLEDIIRMFRETEGMLQ